LDLEYAEHMVKCHFFLYTYLEESAVI